MMLLRFSPRGVRRIEEDFNTNVANLNGQLTSSRTATWSKLVGADLGTSGGVINTTNTSNTIYTLDGNYGAFTATLNLNSNTGGDAFYFRVQDANNWIRVRDASDQGSTSNLCSDFQTGESFFDWNSITASPFCSGLSTNQPYFSQFGTTSCGNTVLMSYGHVWEIRPDCVGVIGPSPPVRRLRSQILVSYTSVTRSQSTRFYRTVLEKMTNGVLTTIQAGATQTTSVSNSSNTSYIANSSFASLPSRSIVATVTPTTIQVNGYGLSVNVNDSSFSSSKTVGIGRGASSTFTPSGLTNFVLET